MAAQFKVLAWALQTETAVRLCICSTTSQGGELIFH